MGHSITDTESGETYLLHFERPFKHARHYLGYSSNLGQRIAQHAKGRGARLMEVIREHHISFVVARTWRGNQEKRYKRYHSGVRLCPICQNKQKPYVPGRRRPISELERSFEFFR